MRVPAILRRVLQRCCAEVHLKRFAAVLAVIGGIVEGGRLSLTAIGRALGRRGSPKHDIKRVDRLLSNRKMSRELRLYFRDLAAFVVGTWAKPVVLLDWTKVTDDFHALVAAVPIGGRAVTIYEEVHPERHLGNAKVQAAFLRALADVLPLSCRPIIVTDAGFYGPFFRAVLRRGWDYVGRIRGNATMQLIPSCASMTVAQVYASASPIPRDLGAAVLYAAHRAMDARLVLAAKPRRRRKHPWSHRRTGEGGVARSTVTGAQEPWLLATSLDTETAARVVAIYATRMQIEETFRDAKNHRFGWSLRHVRGYQAARLTLLLLFGALATLAVVLLGLAATKAGWHRRYQANTEKTRTLSFFVLGLSLIRRRDYRLGDVLRIARLHFQTVAQALGPE